MCVCVYMYVYTAHLLIHSSVDGRLGWLDILAIVNGAAVNIGVHVSFQISILLSGYMPKHGIIGLYGNSGASLVA